MGRYLLQGEYQCISISALLTSPTGGSQCPMRESTFQKRSVVQLFLVIDWCRSIVFYINVVIVGKLQLSNMLLMQLEESRIAVVSGVASCIMRGW